MASTQYNELCEEIYVQIMERMERGHEEGGRFAPHGTARKVLQPEVLRRFFRSLQLDMSNFDIEDGLLKMRQRKLYDFLAILIFTSCTIEAARTFTIKLLAQTTSPDIYALPAERKTLTEIFGEQVTPDKFMTQQACFCPIVICNKKEVRIPSLDRQCLPYLEQKFRGKGAYGTVYQVKIAKGHFYDSDIRGTNQQPKEMARKDYQSTRDMEQDILKKILACDRTCPNIVDIYGSLSIGTNYSIFMPLAICDLSAHMKEDNRTRPYTTAEKADIIHCARGLARGLEFLHNGMRTAEGDRIVCYHMDLKPSNILVFLENVENVGDKQGFVWKISDFGMSRLKLRSRREETDFDSWFVRFQQPRDVSASATYNRRGDGGTYLGPESLSPHRAMRTANDIWSLGCVLSIVFAYLEEGSSGVEKYRERRRQHRASDGDRFFVTNSLFSRPRIHPEVTEWHDNLIKKARKRSPKEGEALKSMLDYLEREVLQPDQLKRCKADQLEEKLLDTYRKYKELENQGSLSLPEEESGLGSRLRRKRIDVLIGKKPATDRSVERWYLREPEPFKGCEISPDGTVIAFWTDTKISLYTSQSLEQDEVDIVRPAAEYPIPIRECRWKSISLTRKHLIASTSGGSFQCYIFKLRRGLVGMDVNLRHGDRISLPTLPEIKKVALAPGGQRLACVVSDKDEDQNPGSLYIGSIHSPYDWQLGNKLDWPAADVIQLSFSTDEDLHMVFRPQRSGPNRKHEIPVIHVSLRSNQLCPLIIEPQGLESSSTVGLFTTFAPLSQKPHVCVLVTREKQLHIQSLAQLDKAAAIQADIKNYRVLKLMMGKDDEKIFAVGRRAAHHKMLLLEIDMPVPQATKISVTELAEIPGLAYSDDFAERVVHSESESVVILAALMGANQCGIYKITVPSSRSGTSAAA